MKDKFDLNSESEVKPISVIEFGQYWNSALYFYSIRRHIPTHIDCSSHMYLTGLVRRLIRKFHVIIPTVYATFSPSVHPCVQCLLKQVCWYVYKSAKAVAGTTVKIKAAIVSRIILFDFIQIT